MKCPNCNKELELDYYETFLGVNLQGESVYRRVEVCSNCDDVIVDETDFIYTTDSSNRITDTVVGINKLNE